MRLQPHKSITSESVEDKLKWSDANKKYAHRNKEDLKIYKSTLDDIFTSSKINSFIRFDKNISDYYPIMIEIKRHTSKKSSKIIKTTLKNYFNINTINNLLQNKDWPR